MLVRLLEPGASKIALLSGDLKLVDVGTIFEVSRDGRETRVQVSQGAVVADPDGARLRLEMGTLPAPVVQPFGPRPQFP
mgnify:CR=1 FL=1